VNTAVLRRELHGYIDTMPERNLHALKPLLSMLADPYYTVETDLTSKEIAMINEGMEEYKEDPSSFIPLENIK